jgi:hypothetical protein
LVVGVWYVVCLRWHTVCHESRGVVEVEVSGR